MTDCDGLAPIRELARGLVRVDFNEGEQTASVAHHGDCAKPIDESSERGGFGSEASPLAHLNVLAHTSLHG
jgi:hypothetical protein